MADFSEITQEINEQITTNGQRAITGAKLNTVLRDMVSAVNDKKQDPIQDLSEIRSGAALGATALQSEQDPTVPSWAKQPNKPSYNYSEIGNTPDLSGFITNTVNNLTNYYLKSETYTKDEVAALIAAIQQFHYEIYATLPQTGQSNVLYLIGPTGSGSDRYEEYVYTNNAFTKIGDTSIDLSGYVTTSALNTTLAGYTPTSELAEVATSGSYNDLTNKPSIPDISGKADKVQNATNGNLAGLDSNGNLTDSGISSADVSLQNSTPKIYSYQYIDQLTSEQMSALKVGDIVLADHSNPSYSGATKAYYVTYKDNAECNIDTQFNGENYQIGYMFSNDSWIYISTEICSLSDLMPKPNGVTGGHLASFTLDGSVIDSGKSVSDFATASQGALADTAYQKPSTGIPASDLASGVIPQPEVFVATVNRTTYQEVADALSEGKVVIAVVSNKTYHYAGLSLYNDYMFFSFLEQSYSYIGVNSSDLWYMSPASDLEFTYNKVTSISSSSTDIQYPSAKCVYDTLLDYVQKSQTSGLLKNDGTVDTTQYGTYSKPSGGIPASDLASGVIPSVPVQDVTVGGTSVVSSGTAAIPAIPTVPTISTDVATDKADNTKTTGAKAVYDAIHPAYGSSQPQDGMLPNVLYKLGTLSGSVTIAFATPTDNTIENEYKFTFTADSTAPTITWPSGITWIGNSLTSGAPKVEASNYYECSVIDGHGIFNKF